MKHLVQLFGPNYAKLTGAVLLNILLISSIVFGVNYYQFNNTFDARYNSAQVMDIESNGNQVAWIGLASSYDDTIFNETDMNHYFTSSSSNFTLNLINSKQKPFQFPILNEVVTGFTHNTTGYSFDILEFTSSDLLIELKISNRTEYTYENGTRHYNNDKFKYLLHATPDSLENPTEIEYWIVKLNDTSGIYDWKIHNGNMYVVVKYGNRTHIVTSSYLRDDIVNKVTSSYHYVDTEPITSITRTGLFDLPEIPTLNLTQMIGDLIEEYPDRYHVPEVDLFYSLQIAQVDNGLHLLGNGRSVDIGEKPASNSPEYLYVNTETNETYVWDLIPDDVSHSITTLDVVDHSVIISVSAPSLNHYYENSSKFWVSQEDFEYDFTWRKWRHTIYIQVATFDYKNPDLSNYVQFKSNLSRTENSSVIYPRLSEFNKLPYQTIGSRSSNTQVESFVHNGKLNLFVDLYKMENGFSDYLLYKNSTGQFQGSSGYAGQSLVTFSFDPQSQQISSGNVLVGPKDPFPIYQGDNEEKIIDKLQNDWKGWDVRKIYGIIKWVDNNQQKYYIALSGSYKEFPAIGIEKEGYYSLLMKEVA